MPEGVTTHLHHHLSFATASPSSYAYHESWIITWLLKQAKLHTALRKPKDPLTAEGSATRWRTFRSRPKTPAHFPRVPKWSSFSPQPSYLSRKKAGQESGSTKGKQNRIWQWFFGSITDSRPRRLASTPVDLSCSPPPLTQPGGGLM